MTQLNDVSFMQMKFQIFKITFHSSIIIRQLNIFFESSPYYILSNLSISDFFVIFHWKLCICEVALFKKLEFNEKSFELETGSFF